MKLLRAYLCLLVLVLARVAAGAPCELVDNFTRPLPAGSNVTCAADFEHACVGLAAAALTYQFDPARRQTRADLRLPDEAIPISGAGTLKLWIKGGGSDNELKLCVRHVKIWFDDQGRRRMSEHRDLWLPGVRLNFTEWREFSFDANGITPGKIAWLYIDARGREPRTEGTVLLDDLRLFPKDAKPVATGAMGLIGPTTRSVTDDVAVFLDLRSFSARGTAKVRVRMTMNDRNDNLGVSRDFDLTLAEGGRQQGRHERPVGSLPAAHGRGRPADRRPRRLDRLAPAHVLPARDPAHLEAATPRARVLSQLPSGPPPRARDVRGEAQVRRHLRRRRYRAHAPGTG